MAKEKERTRRDRAGVGPDPDRARRRLVSMDDLEGYSIGDGEPDIRGWDVCTLSGRDLGAVEDLLIDPERGEVVMIEVEMRGEGMHAEVPIRSVQIDRGRKVITVDSGELDTRNDVRARDRVDQTERDALRADARRDTAAAGRTVRYGVEEPHGDPDAAAVTDEVVVERRPMVEEVVVRRRPADD